MAFFIISLKNIVIYFDFLWNDVVEFLCYDAGPLKRCHHETGKTAIFKLLISDSLFVIVPIVEFFQLAFLEFLDLFFHARRMLHQLDIRIAYSFFNYILAFIGGVDQR